MSEPALKQHSEHPSWHWRRRLRLLLLAALIAFLVVYCAIGFTAHRYGLEDRAAAADAIVILGAGVLPDGQPNTAMLRRVLHGAALYRAGYASWVICTGGITGESAVSEAAACAQLLRENGVPQGAILLEEHSRSTEENAIYATAMMRERGWQTALVTSDDYHLWRASLLFAAQGMRVLTSPAQVTTGPIPFPEYLTSVVREVTALLWQRFKDTLRLPITYVP